MTKIELERRVAINREVQRETFRFFALAAFAAVLFIGIGVLLDRLILLRPGIFPARPEVLRLPTNTIVTVIPRSAPR